MNIYISFICTFLLMANTLSQAQGVNNDRSAELFSEMQVTEDNFSGGAEIGLNTIQNSSSTSEVVSIVSLPENLPKYESLNFFINQSGEVVLNEGQAQHSMQAEMDTVIVTNNSHVTWVGSVVQDDMTLSEVRLTQNREGEVTGYLLINDNQYRIRSLSQGGKHALYALDYSEMHKARQESMKDEGKHEEGASLDYNPEFNLQDDTSTQSSTSCGTSRIDVAVFYTSDAASGRDIDSEIAAAMAETNLAYNNSGLNSISLNKVKAEQFDLSESDGDISKDINYFVDNSNLGSEADIAVLLTDDNYGSFWGIASSIPAEINSRHAIVEVDEAHGGYHGFAHEVGHLQGAHHHPDHVSDSAEPEYARGHRFIYFGSYWWQRRSTIMSYEDKPGSPTLTWETVTHFSNPDISYNGESTGSSTNDNVRRMRQTADYVSTLGGEYTEPLQASIDGFINSDTGQGEFTASTCGGEGGYSYEWLWSTTLGGPTTVLSTDKSFTQPFPEGTHYITLEVTSGDGQTSASNRTYHVDGNPGCEDPTVPCTNANNDGLISMNDLKEPATPLETGLSDIYPNPFNPVTTINFELEQDAPVNLAVFDVSGRKVSQLKDAELSQGTHNIEFNGSGLATGTYIVRLAINGQVYSRNISLIK